MHLRSIFIGFAFLLIASGCQKKPKSSYVAPHRQTGEEDQAATSESQPQNGGDSLTDDEIAKMKGMSDRNSVRFKKKNLLANDLSKGFELTSEELCQELSTKNCLDEVHHLSLGGVDAYNRGVFAGITESMVTSPIALERIVLAACSERATRDFDNNGAAIIFKDLPVNTDGSLGKGAVAAMEASVNTLYDRFLKRKAEPHEVQGLIDMYEQVAQQSQGHAGFEWARLSCYAVVSQLEFAFY